MIIRNPQVAAFQKQAENNFEERAINYVSEIFARRCEIIEQENLRSIFRFGRSRAGNYQCFGEQGIVIYLYLMFFLGSDFDSDPQLPWANEVLTKRDRDEIMRMDLLWQMAHEYAFSVNGNSNEYLNRAIIKVTEYPLLTFSSDLGANFDEHVSRLLRNLYPEKYDTLFESALTALIKSATDKSVRFGINSKIGIRILAVFMFMFGGGFDADPLQPWAVKILQDEAVTDPNTKVSLLHTEGLKHLKLYLPT